jgi:hypothetical protein
MIGFNRPEQVPWFLFHTHILYLFEKVEILSGVLNFEFPLFMVGISAVSDINLIYPFRDSSDSIGCSARLTLISTIASGISTDNAFIQSAFFFVAIFFALFTPVGVETAPGVLEVVVVVVVVVVVDTGAVTVIGFGAIIIQTHFIYVHKELSNNKIIIFTWGGYRFSIGSKRVHDLFVSTPNY